MKDMEDMTVPEMLDELNKHLIIDCLNKVRDGNIEKGDLGSMVTLLKNNKVVQDKAVHSESDLIDELIE